MSKQDKLVMKACVLAFVFLVGLLVGERYQTPKTTAASKLLVSADSVVAK